MYLFACFLFIFYFGCMFVHFLLFYFLFYFLKLHGSWNENDFSFDINVSISLFPFFFFFGCMFIHFPKIYELLAVCVAFIIRMSHHQLEDKCEMQY